MTRCANGPVSQFISRNSGNGITWSNKLDILLRNFNLKSKIGSSSVSIPLQYLPSHVLLDDQNLIFIVLCM